MAYGNQAAFRLRALGRLREAVEPLRAGLEMGVEQEDWRNVSQGAANLSELELTQGEVDGAVHDAFLVASELGSSAVESCVLNAIRTVRAPSVAGSAGTAPVREA